MDMFWISVKFSIHLLISQWGLLHIQGVQFKTEITQGKLNGLTFSHIMYNLQHVNTGYGNDLF